MPSMDADFMMVPKLRFHFDSFGSSNDHHHILHMDSSHSNVLLENGPSMSLGFSIRTFRQNESLAVLRPFIHAFTYHEVWPRKDITPRLSACMPDLMVG